MFYAEETNDALIAEQASSTSQTSLMLLGEDECQVPEPETVRDACVTAFSHSQQQHCENRMDQDIFIADPLCEFGSTEDCDEQHLLILPSHDVERQQQPQQHHQVVALLPPRSPTSTLQDIYHSATFDSLKNNLIDEVPFALLPPVASHHRRRRRRPVCTFLNYLGTRLYQTSLPTTNTIVPTATTLQNSSLACRKNKRLRRNGRNAMHFRSNTSSSKRRKCHGEDAVVIVPDSSSAINKESRLEEANRSSQVEDDDNIVIQHNNDTNSTTASSGDSWLSNDLVWRHLSDKLKRLQNEADMMQAELLRLAATNHKQQEEADAINRDEQQVAHKNDTEQEMG